MRNAMTLAEWEEYLLNDEMEALDEYFYQDYTSKFSASEVLDAITKYNGGIASGYAIKSLISRVYGIELD